MSSPRVDLIEQSVELLPGDSLGGGLGHSAVQGSLHALGGVQGRLQGNALPHRGPLLGLDLLLPPPRCRHLSSHTTKPAEIAGKSYKFFINH